MGGGLVLGGVGRTRWARHERRTGVHNCCASAVAMATRDVVLALRFFLPQSSRQVSLMSVSTETNRKRFDAPTGSLRP